MIREADSQANLGADTSPSWRKSASMDGLMATTLSIKAGGARRRWEIDCCSFKIYVLSLSNCRPCTTVCPHLSEYLCAFKTICAGCLYVLYLMQGGVSVINSQPRQHGPDYLVSLVGPRAARRLSVSQPPAQAGKSGSDRPTHAAVSPPTRGTLGTVAGTSEDRRFHSKLISVR